MSFFVLLTFFLFLALALDVWCFTTNGPPHAWVNMEYKLRKCKDVYSSLNKENLILDVDSLKRSLNSSDKWWTHFSRNIYYLKLCLQHQFEFFLY